MHKLDHLAAGNFPYTKFSLDYTLDSLQRLGFSKIELYCSYPHFCLDDADAGRLNKLKSQLRAHQLSPVCLTPPQFKYPVNIASSDPVRRKKSIEIMDKALCSAAALECPLVLIHGGYPLNDESADEAWLRSADSLFHLSRRAETEGLGIVLETVDVRWKTVLRNSQKAAEMIALVGSDRLHGMLDFITLAHAGESVEQAYNNLSSNVAHCHFSDGHSDRKRLAHLVPGEGSIDLGAMLNQLEGCGYSGYISIELSAGYEDCPEEAIAKCRTWLESRLQNQS